MQVSGHLHIRLLYPLDVRLGGPQNWSGHYRKAGKKTLPQLQGVKSSVLTFQLVA
jgi:hypothetical protein